MIWVACAAVMVVALLVLAVVLLRTWRSVKRLSQEVARAGDAVEAATAGLEPLPPARRTVEQPSKEEHRVQPRSH